MCIWQFKNERLFVCVAELGTVRVGSHSGDYILGCPKSFFPGRAWCHSVLVQLELSLIRSFCSPVESKSAFTIGLCQVVTFLSVYKEL